MTKNISKLSFLLLAFLAFTIFTDISVSAQTAQREPELSIAGFKLGGDEETTKAMLQGYSPRYDNELGQPKFYFYNGYANQVMAITGYSKERPYLVVAIDVFAVGESYQKKHFQMKDKNSFMSESGFFIGARPSVTSMMFAIPNVTKAKQIIKKKGLPDADQKVSKVRTLSYQFDKTEALKNEEAKLEGVNFGAYTAEYRFVKNKLRHFTISINTNPPVAAK